MDTICPLSGLYMEQKLFQSSQVLVFKLLEDHIQAMLDPFGRHSIHVQKNLNKKIGTRNTIFAHDKELERLIIICLL